jgi:hypothetical protein
MLETSNDHVGTTSPGRACGRRRRRPLATWSPAAILLAVGSPLVPGPSWASRGKSEEQALSQWTLISEGAYEVEDIELFFSDALDPDPDPDPEPEENFTLATGFIQGNSEGLGEAYGLWGSAVGDPSVCYHVQLVNGASDSSDPLLPDPDPIVVSAELPLAAFGPHTLRTELDVTVEDRNGDGIAYLRPVTVGGFLQRAYAWSESTEASSARTDGSIESAGSYHFEASGAGGGLGDGNLSVNMHVRLSPEDRLVVRGRVVLDDGSGAPLCEIPDPARCLDGARDLCLQQERFAVDVRGFGHDGEFFRGKTVPGGSTDTGLFWFFEPDNWELLTKVLDGCALNGHYWVLQAAVTDVAFETEVYDIATGRSRTYSNPAGRAAPATIDTSAFPCGESVAAGAAITAAVPSGAALLAARAVDAALDRAVAAPSLRSGPPAASFDRSEDARSGSLAASSAAGAAACADQPDALCLAGDRYAVTVDWRSANDGGSAQVAPLGSDDSGIFYFFDPNNWEMLVKVLDACAVNGHRWVFAAATTDVEYTLRVTDTVTGEAKEYSNALGNRAPAITDTGAFACQP